MGSARVMVVADNNCTLLAHELNAFVGKRTIPHYVAQADECVGPPFAHLFQHASEGFQITVDVGKDSDTHGSYS